MATHIGTATSRVDGRAKVTGTATYAAEFDAPNLAHGAIVTATITKGRITQIDAAAALAVPGVIDVITHRNRPRMADTDAAYYDDLASGGSPYRPLYDADIRFNGQPIAVVMAEDFETARYAATLVRVSYEAESFATDFEASRDQAVRIDKPEKPRGDAKAAFAAAAIRHDAAYFVPSEYHNPMEPFAATVVPEANGKLTVYDKTQGVQNVQRYLCSVFGLAGDDVRVMSPFVGGAFGAGLRPQYEAVLAVLAAQKLQRPARVVLTRAQMYGLPFRAATVEHLAIGAGREGRLESLTHRAIAVTSRHEQFSRNDTGWAELLYSCPNVDFEHRLAALDLPTPGDMRGPGAATGVFGLECAMDEVAVALGIDPLKLRLDNYSDVDQANGLAYTSKELRECYRRGADAFGWDKRSPAPRSMRDGKELVGWGMATGVWEALHVQTAARIKLTGNGHAEVSCATSDIGTGTYTVMAQVTADLLGLAIADITVRLGDSTLPPAPVEGGSWTAASVSHAIAAAAGEVRKHLLQLASALPDSPFASAKDDEVELVGGTLAVKGEPSRAVSIPDILRRSGLDHIEHTKAAEFAKGTSAFEPGATHARNTHAAVFAEVKVDEDIGVIRVTRIVDAVAAGRIINPKTARSQILGGIVWGIGMALHEETLIDHRFGRVMNANIAEYHVPVHADVQNIEVIFVDEPDTLVNPMGIKGVGEIGIVGVAAAIANAVYHATGKRVRDLPITLDKVRA